MADPIQVDPSQVSAITVDPSQVQAMPAAKPRTWLDSAGDFFKGAIDNLAQTGQGMVDTGKAIGQTIAHPIDTLEGKTGVTKLVGQIGASQDSLRLKAEEAFKKGDYVEGVRHVLSYLVPIVGPSIDALGDQAQSGQVAKALGGATSLGLQLAGPEALSNTVPKVAPPIAPGTVPEAPAAPLVKSRLNPVQQSAVDFLQSRDVPLGAPVITGNRFLKGAGKLAGTSPLGAGITEDAINATEQGMARVGGELADQAHPEPVTPESAGVKVKGALDSKIADMSLAEDEAYAKAWKGRDDPQFTYEVPVRVEVRPVIDAAGNPTGQVEKVPVKKEVNMPVNLTNIKDQLRPVMDEMAWIPPVVKDASAGFQAVKNILEGDDFIPAWQAEHGLSGIKTLARTTNKTGVRNASQGIAAGIVPELQQEIDAAVANTGDEALRGLQEGRATHAGKMEIADLAEQFSTEPVKTFNHLVWQKDTGIDFLRKIREQAPQIMPQIGRAFVQQLFDKATADGGFSRAQGIGRQWENLGPETKKLLYPNPALRSGLDNFFHGAKLVAENPNPSGTAYVTQTASLGTSAVGSAAMLLHNPAAAVSGLAGVGLYALGGKAIAKLLYSPAGVKLLTGGFKAESPAAAAARVGRILDITGTDDVTPVKQ